MQFNSLEQPLFSLLFVCYVIHLYSSRRSKHGSQMPVLVSDPSTLVDQAKESEMAVLPPPVGHCPLSWKGDPVARSRLKAPPLSACKTL